jgi:hypothetical protein
MDDSHFGYKQLKKKESLQVPRSDLTEVGSATTITVGGGEEGWRGGGAHTHTRVLSLLLENCGGGHEAFVIESRVLTGHRKCGLLTYI